MIMIAQLILKVPMCVDLIACRFFQFTFRLHRGPVGAAVGNRHEFAMRWKQRVGEEIGNVAENIGAGFVGEFGECDDRVERGEIWQWIRLDEKSAGVGAIFCRALVERGLQPLGVGWVV